MRSSDGLVVAVEPTAARIGAQVLSAGGNAVDAAVATTLALAVTHPSAASLGGGGFALVRARSGETSAFDFREVAPRSLTRARFERMIAAGARGPESVGVPGMVAGLALLLERFGTRSLADLLGPARELARAGHALGPWQAQLIRSSFPLLSQDPAAQRVFGRRGRPLAAGERLGQADLAWCFEQLATGGAEAFYTGAIARRLVRALAPNGPTLEDLAGYRALLREPLRVPYGDFTLETMPPPSAGGVALIGTLLAARAAPVALDPVGRVHVLLEAERRAQAVRRLQIVDPDTLGPEQNAARQARFTDPRFWQTPPIDPGRATPSRALVTAPAEPSAESEHTTHLSVVDRDGLVVSLTTTLSGSFGAKLVAHGTGIVLNNSVGSFGSTGDNQPRGGQRTVSSMAPTLLLWQGETRAVLGTPGGDTIPSTLAQLVRHLIDDRLALDRAVEAPRWHHGFLPDVARYETTPEPDRALLRALTARGHQLRAAPRRFGDANCIVLSGLLAFGYADSREPGLAVAALPYE